MRTGVVPERITHIRPDGRVLSLGLREVWAGRELLLFLAWRDVSARYKQTVIGVGWAVIQPVATMIVFSVFFGRLAGVQSDGLPYPLFAFAALVPWTFFSQGLVQGANSILVNQALVTKVYFPRLIIPFASILSCVVDFAIAFTVLIAMMLYYGVMPGARVILVIPFFLMALVAVAGFALWLSALNVKYRDVRYVTPFLVQLMLFATPIAYSDSIVQGSWRTVYALNPMVGVVTGFRWALLGSNPPEIAALLVSCTAAVLLFASGVLYFRFAERTFADIA